MTRKGSWADVFSVKLQRREMEEEEEMVHGFVDVVACAVFDVACSRRLLPERCGGLHPNLPAGHLVLHHSPACVSWLQAAENSMDIDTELASCERSSDLWYLDGSVVLRADHTLFRVYSGILSQASSVFKDMFTMPQPEDCESYEGCPLVHLPDAASDLYPFLKAMHDCR